MPFLSSTTTSDPTGLLLPPIPTTPPLAMATTTTAIGAPTDGPPSNPTECRLLGPFAILVQLALGALALLALVYKRWRERPQRPVKVWWFDVSKQVFGSVLVHAANVFMSMLTSGRFNLLRVEPPSASAGAARAVAVVVRRAVEVGVGVVFGREGSGGGGGGEEYVPNPCSFYLLNLAIDTTVGIPILIVLVRVLTRLVAFTPLGQPPESIQSGFYGTPPNAWWWLKQSIIYFCGLMGMKFFVLVLFMMLPWLPRIGDWALGWTEGNERLQIVFVMMLFPLIMNALQYYIIDSYIKMQEALTTDGDDGAGAAEGAVVYDELAASETDESDAEEEAGAGKGAQPRKGLQSRVATRGSAVAGRSSRDLEYDPTVDGDSQTVIGSSSSRISSAGKVPEELLPPE